MQRWKKKNTKVIVVLIFVFLKKRNHQRGFEEIFLNGNFVRISTISCLAIYFLAAPFLKCFVFGCETAPVFWHFFGRNIFGAIFGREGALGGTQ